MQNKNSNFIHLNKFKIISNTVKITLALFISLCSHTSFAASYRHSTYPTVDLSKSRIVGYYGNFYSKRMGILGEYPPDVMLRMFKKELQSWRQADPNTPVIPAIEYIAIVAQKDAGVDGKYRAVMPDKEIYKAIHLAEQINGIVILDVQVGRSTLAAELPKLERYLRMPNVMLAIDPEFSMPQGTKPGSRIGTIDGSEINYAIDYLSNLVKKYDLPPKVLVVHRFTQKMVTNHQKIRPNAQVQVVMDMDGFGSQSLKRDSYRYFIAAEPVQFTGIKLFYKQDTKGNPNELFTPEQILKLKPVPKFILYQ